MTALKIYVDFVMPVSAMELLLDGTRGHELIFPDTLAPSVLVKSGLDPKFRDADIAFGQPDTRAIAEADHLKWVHVSSSGHTRYDNPEFRSLVASRNICVSNSALVYQEACADHALSFMLAQSRELPTSLTTRTSGSSGEWLALRGSCVPLKGSSAIIVGFGAIGRRLIELLGPYGMSISAYRRKARGDEGVPVVTLEDLPAVLAKADHVINILPDSAETRGFFNKERFDGLKPESVFYNIGRGTTVDQDALLTALRAGIPRAAWLDVTDPEPLPDDHPLWREAHCHITPHVAGGHRDEAGTLVRHFLANLERFQRGASLLDRIM